MADRKISEFVTMLGSEVDLDNDFFPIVDVNASDPNKNKKISPREFLRLAAKITGIVSIMDDPYDASVGTIGSPLFPSTGGTGAAGAIQKGNAFEVSVFGYVPGSDESQGVPVGTLLIALDDNPAQDPTKWRIL